MCIKNLIEQIEKSQKNREIISCKRRELFEIMKFETIQENKKNYQKMIKIEQKLKKVEEIIRETKNIIDDILENNFDIIDIKIFVLKFYRKQTFSKIAEIVNYSEKQVQRRYKKILEYKI